jgi:hypothetical protein
MNQREKYNYQIKLAFIIASTLIIALAITIFSPTSSQVRLRLGPANLEIMKK